LRDVLGSSQEFGL